jgi:hypothetical protein
VKLCSGMNISCRACRRYPIIITYVLISVKADWINFKISTYLSLIFFSLHMIQFYKHEKYSSDWLGVLLKRLDGARCQGSEIFFQPTFLFLPLTQGGLFSVVLKRCECKADNSNIHLMRRISLCRTRIPLLIPLLVAYLTYFLFRKFCFFFWNL